LDIPHAIATMGVNEWVRIYGLGIAKPIVIPTHSTDPRVSLLNAQSENKFCLFRLESAQSWTSD